MRFKPVEENNTYSLTGCNNINLQLNMQEIALQKQIKMFHESNKNENFPYYFETQNNYNGNHDDDNDDQLLSFDFFDYEYLFNYQYCIDNSIFKDIELITLTARCDESTKSIQSMHGHVVNKHDLTVSYASVGHFGRYVASTDCGYMRYLTGDNAIKIAFIFGDMYQKQLQSKIDNTVINEKLYLLKIDKSIGKEKVKTITNVIEHLWQNNQLFKLNARFNYLLNRHEIDCQLQLNNSCFDQHAYGTILHKDALEIKSIPLSFLLQFGKIYFDLIEYSLREYNKNRRIFTATTFQGLTIDDNCFLGQQTVHPVFIISNTPINHLITITNNVIEEIDTNITINDATKAPRHIYQLLNALKSDRKCHFRSKDDFSVIFFRIDSRYRIYQITRNYNKFPAPLTDTMANSIKFEGYMFHYSPMQLHTSSELDDSGNLCVKLSPIEDFRRLCSIFCFQSKPKWYVLLNHRLAANKLVCYWKPYTRLQQLKIDEAFRNDGKTIIKVNQHNSCSVYVGKSRPNPDSWDKDGILPTKEQLRNSFHGELTGREMHLQGYYRDILYAFPFDGTIRGFPIGEETVFETDFLFRYQPATFHCASDDKCIVFECVQDLLCLLPLSVKNKMDDTIRANDGIININDASLSLMKHGHLVGSSANCSIFNKMCCLDMNRQLLLVYFKWLYLEYFRTQRNLKKWDCRKQFSQMVHFDSQVSEPKSNCNDGNTLDTYRDTTSLFVSELHDSNQISSFQDLIFYLQSRDMKNASHFVIAALCPAPSQNAPRTVLPYYGICGVRMFYQSNLRRWDGLAQLRASSMANMQDISNQAIGTTFESTAYTIRQGIYHFFFPHADVYNQQQQQAALTEPEETKYSESLAKTHGTCCKIIIVPSRILLEIIRIVTCGDKRIN